MITNDDVLMTDLVPFLLIIYRLKTNKLLLSLLTARSNNNMDNLQ